MVFALALDFRFCCFCKTEPKLDVAVVSGGGVVDSVVLLHEDVAEVPVLVLDVGLFEKCEVTSVDVVTDFSAWNHKLLSCHFERVAFSTKRKVDGGISVGTS